MKVVRIHFKDGQSTGFEDFLGTFLIEGGAANSAGWPASPWPRTARSSSRTTRTA
jgi:hypothetical protein